MKEHLADKFSADTIEGIADKCPTCGHKQCIGRIQTESCSNMPDLYRRAHLAYLYLNMRYCTHCKLPKNEGFVCPCGVDE